MAIIHSTVLTDEDSDDTITLGPDEVILKMESHREPIILGNFRYGDQIRGLRNLATLINAAADRAEQELTQ